MVHVVSITTVLSISATITTIVAIVNAYHIPIMMKSSTRVCRSYRPKRRLLSSSRSRQQQQRTFETTTTTTASPSVRNKKHSVKLMQLFSTTSSATDTITTTTISDTLRLSNDAIEHLIQHRYVVVPNFLSTTTQSELRNDMNTLRTTTTTNNGDTSSSSSSSFRQANIGQDSTNQYNSIIRKTETCFIGNTPEKQAFNQQYPNEARFALYNTIDTIRKQLSTKFSIELDASLTENLYAYYPKHGNGYYRIHMDAVPNSISYLRQFSFLIYLSSSEDNDGCSDDWDIDRDGGILRMYIPKQGPGPRGGGAAAAAATMNFDDDHFDTSQYTPIDVIPNNGTLVLFDSHYIPHEVLDTKARERYVIIGWFNRRINLIKDMNMLSTKNNGSNVGSSDPSTMLTRIGLLSVAMVLMSYGVSLL